MKNNENWQRVRKNYKERKEKSSGFAHSTPFQLLKEVREKSVI